MNCIYEGSVKRVWQPADKQDRLWFEFTDDYSVFDWGKMPDTIANKGKALTAFGAYFFEELSRPSFWQNLADSASTQGALSFLDKDWWQARKSHPVFSSLLKEGAPNHHLALVDESGNPIAVKDVASTPRAFLEVVKAHVPKVKPATISGQTVYFYPQDMHTHHTRLVPLEVVFRFGMPAGSSLKSRLDRNPDYARELGLPAVPSEGEWFDRPVLEYFTKLEPKDRLLSLQEALTISTLTLEKFEELTELAADLATGLFAHFAERGVELWDGKFEFIIQGDKLLLADSIGPDELRLLYNESHLSKEFIRQLYRDSQWLKALKEAQKLAITRGAHDWKAICASELGHEPAPLSKQAKALTDALYPALCNHVTGQQVFADQPKLDVLSKNLLAYKEE